MIKYLFWLGLLLFAVWFLKATGIVVAATLFLLVGAIPGTQWSIPPIPMLIVLAGLLAITLYWLKRQRLAQQIKQLRRRSTKQEKAAPKKSTNRSRARYSQPKAATH
jgi:flagellar biosynthesis component FlhA